MRGADLLVQSLKAAGVTRIFSLSGNQIMPVYDACIGQGIELVHTRHEAACVYMAEAHAQLTGEVGVALVTAGGGLGNAVGALFPARESETPVLLLSGDSPVGQDGRGAFQEMDQLAMTRPLTKLSLRPTRAADLGEAAARAFRVARSGRPGPVHIALAFDVLEADCDGAAPPRARDFARVPQPPGEGDLRLIAQAVAAAKRPVVLVGPALGESRSGDLLPRLAEALDAPVIAMESPRGLRDPSLGALAAVLAEADLIVNLGKRVDFTLGFGAVPAFAAQAGWILVESAREEQDRAHHNLGPRLQLAITADPLDCAVRLAAARAQGDSRAAWRAQAAQAFARRVGETASPGETITSAALCAAVQRQLARRGASVLVCDGGEFGQWAQAIGKGSRRVVNGVSGVIGGGVCYGIAAALACPDHAVVALMGDGSAGFHFPEIETAARCGAALVLVIGNDLRWNAEHQIQLREYGPDRLIGCQLSDARYDLAAAALGGHGEYVTRPADLDAALSRAFDGGKPACVNVIIDGTPAPTLSAR
ncbi:thiamine pyrophosphate-binding protein [Pseudogemmobacter sonorensis]|uniref:thiamine pyrophosphate-binding protein n=1 Tax=Pseudogemmobacter sonorensis TaxID=2989681 RepID=UPI00367DFF26